MDTLGDANRDLLDPAVSRGACAVIKLKDLKSRIVAAFDYVNGVDRKNRRSGYLLAGDFALMRSAMAR